MKYEKPKCDCGEELIYNKTCRVSSYFSLDDNGFVKQCLSRWDVIGSEQVDSLYCNKCKKVYECVEVDEQYYRKDVFEKLFYEENKMKCLTCNTEMVCYNDVNDIYQRIDWLKCPKCDSKAEIIYGNHGEY